MYDVLYAVRSAFSPLLPSAPISCELLIRELHKNRSVSDLQKADLFTRDSLPAGFASTKDQDIAGSSIYDMLCHIDCWFCLNGSFVHSQCPVYTVLFEMWPLRGQRCHRRSSDWDEAVRCCGVEHFLPCLTTVATLLQVNFERRRPFFTRLPKRNAKWRTARRPMESPAVQVKKKEIFTSVMRVGLIKTCLVPVSIALCKGNSTCLTVSNTLFNLEKRRKRQREVNVFFQKLIHII